jgi:hypothetical protein
MANEPSVIFYESFMLKHASLTGSQEMEAHPNTSIFNIEMVTPFLWLALWAVPSSEVCR